MHIVIERVYIFRALQNVLGVVGGGRASMPILGHVLLEIRDGVLFITGSDVDIEIIVSISIYKIYEVGAITIPAKKFFDICRILSDKSKIVLKNQEDKLLIHSENGFFSLTTFPALDFPNISSWKSELEFSISSSILKNLVESTQFSMGKQDARYYLNGMLFKFEMSEFYTVATDGHRLAICKTSMFLKDMKIKASYSVIVPRKYIMNLIRILNIQEKNIKLIVSKRNISIKIANYILTSKLINGSFPDYQSVFSEQIVDILEVDSNMLMKAIKCSIVLCNEKFHIVKFLLSMNQLKIFSSNSEHETSEQVLDVIYPGKELEIGFNVYYILDVLNVIKSEKVQFLFTDANSSVQIMSYPAGIGTYVVMPIRL